MSKKMIIGLVALGLIVVGGLLTYFGSQGEKSESAQSAQSAQSANAAQPSQEMPDDMRMPEQSSQSGGSNSDDAGQASATDQVKIENYAYSPATITVKAGTKVTWTNQDSVKHDVVMDDSSADGPSSELLAKGESYSYTFTKAGTYEYHCSPHPYMKAKVIVTE